MRRGQRLDQAFDSVDRHPERINREYEGETARHNEDSESPEDPVELDVAPFRDKEGKGKGNRESMQPRITASEATCSQINSGSHNKHMPWGENIDESNRRSRRAHIATVTFLKCGNRPTPISSIR